MENNSINNSINNTTNSSENEKNEKNGANRLPLYKHSAQYARENNELELYRASYKANIACKEAIEESIRNNYRDNHLNAKAVYADIKARFGTERMMLVLANTVRAKDWDGRISRQNKAWAKTVPLPDDIDAWKQDRSLYYVIDRAHPCLVDGFLTHAREAFAKEKQTEAEREKPLKKPSVLEKLQNGTEKNPLVKASEALKKSAEVTL